MRRMGDLLDGGCGRGFAFVRHVLLATAELLESIYAVKAPGGRLSSRVTHVRIFFAVSRTRWRS